MARILVRQKSASPSSAPPIPRIRAIENRKRGGAKIENSQAVPQFLLYLEMELGLSPNTIDAYSRDLRDCAAFCELIDTPLTAMDASALARYLQHLQTEKKLATTSILRHIASLKMFFRFATTRGY